jgi:signal transduction histidine kinase
MKRSMRFCVTAVAFALTAGLLAVVSLLMAVVLRSQLTDNLDESIAQRADTIAAVVQRAPLSEIVLDEDLLVQVVRADGTIVGASPNLVGNSPITTLEPGPRTIHNVPGRPEAFRVLVRPTSVDTGAATLIVGINYDDINDPLRILKKLLAFAVPSVLVVLGLLSWWLTGRMLRPVESIRSRMAAINASNLAGRVPEPGNGDEIDRLAHTMNDTLERLEDAVRRQQRFVADASHELRSPLTRMRGELELHLAHPDSTDPLETERSVLTETIALQHLVDDLLQLARADGNVEPQRNDVVDLDDIVLHEVRRLTERGLVQVDTKALSAAQVSGDREQLRRAVRNVLDNAERHANSTVIITLRERNGKAVLAIGDDGLGIATADRHFVFDRFARLDEARSRDRGGSGLATSLFDTAARFASPTGRRPSSSSSFPLPRDRVTIFSAHATSIAADANWEL